MTKNKWQKTFAIVIILIVLIISFITCTSPENHKFGAYYTRLPFSDYHSGKYADIVVRLDELAGEIIFGRESRFLAPVKRGLEMT
jgi:hypothetical protein